MMRSILTVLYFLMFSDFAGYIIAQNNTELDLKYTPNSTSIFNNLKKKNISDKLSSSGISSCVKFYPTMLFRQKVMFSFEKQVIDGLTFNAGIGKAFGSDFFQTAYLKMSDFDFSQKTLGAAALIDGNSYSGSSPLLSGSIKIYYSGNAFEGGFFELNYRRETMRYELPEQINGYILEGDNEATFKMNNYNLAFGYSMMTGSGNKAIHELFISLGLKSFTYPRYDLIDPSQYTGSSQYVYRRSLGDVQSRMAPSIHMGYAIGFGF
jgi:hypothetical protein